MSPKSKRSDERRREIGKSRRERTVERCREEHRAAAEIGRIPAVVNPARRKGCRPDLFVFLTTYFPYSTGLKPFSDDHRKVIARVQRCILTGGRFLNIVYRCFAKTTISENAALWAVLNGHRRFPAIFSADQDAADRIIESIKVELETNDLLLEDFPEVCFPVRCLEGKPQRCHTQTHNGELTHIEWTAKQVVLPTIIGSDGEKTAASGAVILSKGITGAALGIKHKGIDGVGLRPDLLLIDDPQTEESADSPLQVQKRLRIIRRSLLKLGGHNGSLAVVLTGTVKARGDIPDQLLRLEENAAWHGVRIPMVGSWSKVHETFWLDKYATIRKTYSKDDPEDQLRAHREATEFYKKRRKKMDAGCRVSWKHCYDEETEVSAIQHAYNALIDDGEATFASECQNEPLEEQLGAVMLTADEIAERVNGLKRNEMPAKCNHLTMFIDNHDAVLYYVVCAWEDDFTGYVIDYGTLPDQGRRHFTLRDAKYTLARQFPGKGKQGAIYAGLQELAKKYLTKEYRRNDGAILQIGRCLADAGYLPDTIHAAIRGSGHGAVLMPSRGRPITASGKPMAEYTRKRGDRSGHHWRLPAIRAARELRTVEMDTNYWKSAIHAALVLGPGSRGGLSLWGTKRTDHRLFAEHAVAEYGVATEGQGRKLEEWKERPGHPDNHWGDGLVGCAVAGSMLGAKLPVVDESNRLRKRKRVRLSDVQRQKRAG